MSSRLNKKHIPATLNPMKLSANDLLWRTEKIEGPHGLSRTKNDTRKSDKYKKLLDEKLI